MRPILRFMAVMLLVLNGWWVAPAPKVTAASLDTTADIVIGQPNFMTSTGNAGASGINAPFGMTVDAQGNLFVADSSNNRVLEYFAPIIPGMAASKVFGQPDFNTTSCNVSVNANTLCSPIGMAVDSQGDLYVSDFVDNRVLEYATPLTSGMSASKVFGQGGNFTTTDVNKGGVSADSLYKPDGMKFDSQGNLYIADFGNNRVLEYNTPQTSDTTADRVFGQSDFTSDVSNNGGVSEKSLSNPVGLGLNAQDDVFIADYGNHRVLHFDTPLITDTIADNVFGQPDFSSNMPNNGGENAKSLYHPEDVAVDARGDLYVPDVYNHRILEYTPPFANYLAASMVFGQGGGFTTGDPNHGGVVSADGLDMPTSVAVDSRGNLYVTDRINNRVLEYDLPLPNGVPTTGSLNPSTLPMGSPGFRLFVFGSGFLANSIVRWNGSDRLTTYMNFTQISASITATDIANGGPFAVTVFNPTPGGGTSGSLLFTVTSAGNGVPELNSISPTTIAVGSPGFTLTVNGTGFVPSSVVRWNGGDLSTTYMNTTQLKATINASDVAGGGPYAVTVFNPAPGGGVSGSISFVLTPEEVFLSMVMNNFVAPFLGPWEVEPNDTYLTANGPLISGQPYQGYLNNGYLGNPKDFFSIRVTAPCSINVTLTPPLGSIDIMQLQLFYQDVKGGPVDSALGPSYHVTDPSCRTGWYYIYINAGAAVTVSQPYTFNVIVTQP